MRLAHRLLQPTVVMLFFAAALVPGCKPKKPQLSPEEANKLVIVKAVWGDAEDKQTADITALLTGMIKDNALEVPVTSRALGDPAAFQLKQLRVEWSKAGIVAKKFLKENETLVIRADEKPVPIRLVLVKASYGNFESGKTADVTKQLVDMVKDNTLSVSAGVALFGDPAILEQKQLRIDYTFDGVAKSKTVGENETLTLSEQDK
jgi:hypothetical protein